MLYILKRVVIYECIYNVYEFIYNVVNTFCKYNAVNMKVFTKLYT